MKSRRCGWPSSGAWYFLSQVREALPRLSKLSLAWFYLTKLSLAWFYLTKLSLAWFEIELSISLDNVGFLALELIYFSPFKLWRHRNIKSSWLSHSQRGTKWTCEVCAHSGQIYSLRFQVPTGLLEPVLPGEETEIYLANTKEQLYLHRKCLWRPHRQYMAKMGSGKREHNECVNHTCVWGMDGVGIIGKKMRTSFQEGRSDSKISRMYPPISEEKGQSEWR